MLTRRALYNDIALQDLLLAEACVPSRSGTAHASALSTEAAQNRMAQRHHKRHLATRCATD